MLSPLLVCSSISGSWAILGEYVPWAKDFLVYDIEATGTDPTVYDLAQMGAVKMCASCFKIYDSFVMTARPLGKEVSAQAMSIHQIPLEYLMKATPVAEMLTAWEEWLGPNPKVFMPVTWGFWDQTFMRVIYKRISAMQPADTPKRRYPLTGKQLDAKSIVYAEIAKHKDRYPTGGLGLISVKLGMGPFEQHDALQDAIRTAEILRFHMVPRKRSCKRKHENLVPPAREVPYIIDWDLRRLESPLCVHGVGMGKKCVLCEEAFARFDPDAPNSVFQQ